MGFVTIVTLLAVAYLFADFVATILGLRKEDE